MGDAMAGLLARVLGEDSADYVSRTLPETDGPDRFEIARLEDGRIELAGTGPLAQAAALGWHRRHPDVVPIRRSTPFAYRYFYNFCTFGYTSAFWDWSQWERELDALAMRGVNLPLTLVGQEAVWQRVLRRLGMTDDAIREFLGGPAYLPWLWMGCLRSHDGPLPQSWIDRHAELGRRVTDRMRELGMTPVLPAFAGHIPPEVAAGARASEVDWVGDFRACLLDPTDPLFATVAELHFEEQAELFGPSTSDDRTESPFFAADPFIEMVPPVTEPPQLAALARSIHDRMRAVHPDAVWVLQSWPFDFHADYWTEERKQAFLGGVPDDGMLLLDLWADHRPNVAELGIDKPRVWCMLNNFGGRPGLYGNLERIASAASDAVGLGATMEDSRTNPIVYDLWSDTAWEPEQRIDPTVWVPDWVRNRYRGQAYHGLGPEHRDAAVAAWEQLADHAYASHYPGPVGTVVLLRPSLAEPLVPPEWSRSEAPRPDEVPRALTDALRLLLAAVPEDQPTPHALGRDLADVSFQVLGIEANLAQQRAADAYRAGDSEEFDRAATALLVTIDDLERVLATRPEYLLGRWVADAARWGGTEEERAYYRSDALRLLTMWGPADGPLVDYGRRGWAGLVGEFYRERWQRWVDRLREVLAGQTADPERFVRELTAFENSFVAQPPDFATHPTGDTAAVLRAIRSASTSA